MQIEDIEQYIIRLQLYGIFPFLAQNKQDTGHLTEFIEVYDDITYTNNIGLNIEVEYKAKKGDLLNISNIHNIFPVKQIDFINNYRKVKIDHNVINAF